MTLIEKTIFGIRNKIEITIARIREYEALAVERNSEGYRLAFSGGKDSIVLCDLVKRAGVRFKAFYYITTIDPPELTKYIKRHYPEIIRLKPKMSMWQLMKKMKMLPLRQQRWCCRVFKEPYGENSVTLTGIRNAEGTSRAKRKMFEISNSDSTKIFLNPIIDWTDRDVWEYIHLNNIPYCELYDKGRRRIGCMCCPMASEKPKRMDLHSHPKFRIRLLKTIQWIVDHGGFSKGRLKEKTAGEILEWWITRTKRENPCQLTFLP